MSETEFQVGDVVEAFGVEGVVSEIDDNEPHYPLLVKFPNGEQDYFAISGKYISWHKEPSLKLIERPKKKVLKTMYQAICKYLTGPRFYITDSLYEDEEMAALAHGRKFIALGPAITFKVEE